MKGVFNACDKKNLKLNNPDYVKQYKTGREYFGWEDALSSTCIKTNFGIFTSAKRTRVKNDKGRYEYFITLTNGKEEITIKQNQLCNKKMPNNAVRVSKVNTFIFKGFKYQLCLPPAREYIDLLVEEANRLGEKRNQRILNNPICFDKKGKLKKHIRLTQPLDYINSTFREKFFFAHGLFLDFYEVEEINRIFKKLLASVHPDKTHQNTNEDFLLVMEWCNFN